MSVNLSAPNVPNPNKKQRIFQSRLKVFNKDIVSSDMGIPPGDPADPDFRADRFNIVLNSVPLNNFSGIQSRIGNVIKIHSVEVMLGVVCHPEWLRLVLYVPKRLPSTISERAAVPPSHFGSIDDRLHWVLHDELRYLHVKDDTTNGNQNNGYTISYSGSAEPRTYFIKHRFDPPLVQRFDTILDNFITTHMTNQIRLAAFATGIQPPGQLQVFGWSKIWFSDD